MLAIRLTRIGKTHAPHYRIVVQEKRSKLNGKVIDTIGHYHPAQASKLLVIDKEKAQKWLAQGAQASDTVTNLLVKEGILDKSRTVHNFFTPKTKAEQAKEEAEEAAEKAEKAAEKEAAAEAWAEQQEEAAKEREEQAEDEAEKILEATGAPEPTEEPAAEEAASAEESAE